MYAIPSEVEDLNPYNYVTCDDCGVCLESLADAVCVIVKDADNICVSCYRDIDPDRFFVYSDEE